MKLSWTVCKQMHDKARNPAKGKPVGNSRYVTKLGDDYALELHGTPVLRYSPDGVLTVNTGGYWTTTTSNTLWEYGDVTIYTDRKKVHEHRIKIGRYAGTDYPFEDGIQFKNGRALNAPHDPIRVIDNDKRKELIRLVKQYRRGIAIRCKVGAYDKRNAEACVWLREYSAEDFLRTLRTQDFSTEAMNNIFTWQDVSPKTFTEIYTKDRLKLLEAMDAISYYNPGNEGEGA